MRRVDAPQVGRLRVRRLRFQTQVRERNIRRDRQRQPRFHQEAEIGVAAGEIVLLGDRLPRMLGRQF